MIDKKIKSYKTTCPSCGVDRLVTYAQSWNIRVGNSSGDCLKCSKKEPWNKGTKGKQVAWNKGLIGYNKGHPPYNDGLHFLGKKHSVESKEKMRFAKLGGIGNTLGKHWTISKEAHKRIMETRLRGNKHPKWKKDRNLLKDDHRDRGGQLHREWSLCVKNRDGWKCRIANGNCSGRMESHHILGWKDYPELRHEINNGITLCHFHHPRKRGDEMKLSPYFQSLVAQQKLI